MSYLNPVKPSAGGGLLNKFDATAAPTVNNDETEGYSVGSRWVDVQNNEAYICVDASEGAAVWELSTAGLASEIVFTPAGDIAATDVQGAVEELDTEKAAAGDLSAHTGDTDNPHSVTKEQVGLGNADNTADADKPVSTAQAAADLVSQSEVVGVNEQTDDYVLVIGDKGKLVDMNKATSVNLTVPPNGDVAFPVNTKILVRQKGAGAVTLVAGDGVTLNSLDSALITAGQFATAWLVKVGTNTWAVDGNLEAAA